MTDKDKKRLTELRGQGYTYQQIAEASGVVLSSVKMFFKRNNTPSDDGGICAQCKKPLEKDAPKKKRFCSEKCRIKWWAEHPEQLSNAREHQYKCPACGKDFYSYMPAKFCSLNCYHRSRRKAGEEDEYYSFIGNMNFSVTNTRSQGMAPVLRTAFHLQEHFDSFFGFEFSAQALRRPHGHFTGFRRVIRNDKDLAPRAVPFLVVDIHIGGGSARDPAVGISADRKSVV